MEAVQGRPRLSRRVEKHYYSVPHALLRETLWARIPRGPSSFSIKAIASPSMCARHPTAAHDRARTYAVHTALCRLDAGTHPATGERDRPKTSALIEIILRERTHPEQGFRASIGILRHASNFGHERLEAACGRALDIGARSYTS